MVNLRPTIRLALSSLKRKFPSVDKPLRILAPPKISPSKRAFEKYKPRGLFSEFYGSLYRDFSNIQTASSLSFSSDLVRAMHARGSGEAARRAKRGRPRFALSVTRVAICVSHVLLDGLQKKERLLVVQQYQAINPLYLSDRLAIKSDDHLYFEMIDSGDQEDLQNNAN